MAEQNEIAKSWIVLINKSPKGPLSQEEVKALIDQGLLRMNDLAFQVLPEAEKKQSDWKLLWQFPEFNRRGGAEKRPDAGAPRSMDAIRAPEAAEAAEADAPALPKPAPERRRDMTEEEAKQRVQQELPSDLADINPGDLVARPLNTRMTQEPRPEGGPDEPEVPPTRTVAATSWIFGGGALGFTALVAVWLFKPAETAVETAVRTPPPSRGAGSPPPPLVNPRAPAARPPSAVQAVRPPPPVTRSASSPSSPPPVAARERSSEPESRYDSAYERRILEDRGEIPRPEDEEFIDDEPRDRAGGTSTAGEERETKRPSRGKSRRPVPASDEGESGGNGSDRDRDNDGGGSSSDRDGGDRDFEE